MKILTVHDIGLIKVWVCPVDFGSITILANVVFQIPALVFIKYRKHGMLLLVCFQLERQNHSPIVFKISCFYSTLENIYILS